jgi:hypothetical protein
VPKEANTDFTLDFMLQTSIVRLAKSPITVNAFAALWFAREFGGLRAKRTSTLALNRRGWRCSAAWECPSLSAAALLGTLASAASLGCHPQ